MLIVPRMQNIVGVQAGATMRLQRCLPRATTDVVGVCAPARVLWVLLRPRMARVMMLPGRMAIVCRTPACAATGAGHLGQPPAWCRQPRGASHMGGNGVV